MKQYLDLVKNVLENGVEKTDRTGVGTLSLVGESIQFDHVLENFPLLTTKQMSLRNIVVELLFFLQGRTNNNWLKERGCHIWDEWEYTGEKIVRKRFDEEGFEIAPTYILPGELGPIYGKMWREWPIGNELYDNKRIDQLNCIMGKLKEHSRSRRLVITSWNPIFLPDEDKKHNENIKQGKQVLAACHTMFQFITEPNKNKHEKDYLNLVMYQRSADIALGVPYNIASYAFMLNLMSRRFGYIAKKLVIHFGDAHIYLNQCDGLKMQLEREPKSSPGLNINSDFIDNFLEFDPLNKDTDDMFELIGYDPHPKIVFPPPAV